MKPVFLFIAVLALTLPLFAQTPAPSRHPGVILFEQGKFSEAIRSLEIAGKSKEYREDADIWNYLGLAYLAKDAPKKSRKAFEKSVSLNPASSIFAANLAYAYLATGETTKAFKTANRAIELDTRNPAAYQVRGIVNLWRYNLDPAEADADSFIEGDPQNVDAYLLKSEVLLAKLSVRVAAGNTVRQEISFLKRAAEALELGVSRCKASPEFQKLQSELESITAFYNHFSTTAGVPPGATPMPPAEGVTPFRIIEKPQASYTDRARTNNISGEVRLVAILGANGRVEHVLLIKRLGYGLDQQAIAAAKRIKFEPKKKDGRPVPAVITLEYGFLIY